MTRWFLLIDELLPTGKRVYHATGKLPEARGWEYEKTFDTHEEAKEQIKVWIKQLKGKGVRVR